MWTLGLTLLYAIIFNSGVTFVDVVRLDSTNAARERRRPCKCHASSAYYHLSKLNLYFQIPPL